MLFLHVVLQLTLLSLIQTGALCCLSMSSRTFLYHDSGLVSVILQLNVWPQTFSSFWHCSNSFLLLLCAALQTEPQCQSILPHASVHSLLSPSNKWIFRQVLKLCISTCCLWHIDVFRNNIVLNEQTVKIWLTLGCCTV